jgi:hypothetical protein
VTEAVAADDALLRRVANNPHMWTDEEGIRPSSAAMKPADVDGGLSVSMRRLLENPSEPLSALEGHPDGCGLTELHARDAFDLELDVEHTPLPDDFAHANICGFNRFSKSRAKRLQRKLALAAVCLPRSGSACRRVP